MGRNEDRRRLRGLLLEGAASPPAVTVDADYFDGLRERVRRAPGEVVNTRPRQSPSA